MTAIPPSPSGVEIAAIESIAETTTDFTSFAFIIPIRGPSYSNHVKKSNDSSRETPGKVIAARR